MNCIFCKINNNEAPSYTIYEDDVIRVMLDIHPEECGHCLIIPKKHYQDIEDIDIDTLNHIMMIYKKMYNHIKEKLNIDGLTITQNNGIVEEVKHFHLHLVPKYNIKPKYSIEEVYEILKTNNLI